jgi:hypothetical protein
MNRRHSALFQKQIEKVRAYLLPPAMQKTIRVPLNKGDKHTADEGIVQEI